MASVIQDLPETVQTLLVLTLFFLAKWLWDKSDKKQETHDVALNQNTLALVELKTEFKLFREAHIEVKADVKKLKEDVNDLHRFKRHLQEGQL